MSLLLDALKKAADDKQKVSQAGSSKLDASNPGLADEEKSEHRPSTEELSLQATETSQNASEKLSANSTEDSDELTLDADDINVSNLTLEETELTSDSLPEKKDPNEINAQQVEENVEQKSSELSLEQNKKDKASAAGSYTVSDDALSMLIYKTNRDVKQGNRILFISVLIASLVILVSGGVYYYLDMQAEIAALERKHQIAMQSMRSKTNKEKTPEKSEIISKLVGESDLNDTVQYAKQHIASGKNPSRTQPQVPPKTYIKTEGSARYINTATPALSIQKTNKSDPVGEKLDAAWLAYDSGQYDKANKLYKDVLNIEKNNRDALLGLGAIAVIEKNNPMARDIYLSLLKQDPRDPIATAALASLHSDESSLKSDKEYLLSTLQKNPDAPHLNFALGNIYAQQNKWKSAQQHYFNAWQHDNENADYIFNLAVSMDQLSKQQQAINFYKDSLLKSVNKQVSFSREAVQKRINELSGL